MEVKIKGCGEIRLDLDLVYYPLGDYWYALVYKGMKAVTQAEPIYEEQGDNDAKQKRKKRVKYWILPLSEDETIQFEDNPIGKDMPYKNPINRDIASKWMTEQRLIPIDEIYKDIKKVLHTCYDFGDVKETDIATLLILESWFSDILPAVFYVDIRSQMGGGKTVLLELFAGMSRYGILANDMSFAVIPRMVDRYKCSLFFDEIDMINKHVKEDVFKMLRTGYRKGQKYIRAKPKTFEPECFDVYGVKAFNYRSDVADDLKNRSLSINTAKSRDKILPILNLYKEILLEPVFYKIFCFYMQSMPRLMQVKQIMNEMDEKYVNKDKVDLVNKVNKVNGLLVNTDTDNNIYRLERDCFYSHINLVNQKLFGLNSSFSGTLAPKLGKPPCLPPVNPVNHPLVNMNESELKSYFDKLFENLAGRSIELFALIINLCAYTGLDIYENFKSILEDKAEFEDHDEEDMKNILREILVEFEVGAMEHKGLGAKYKYYRDVQSEFMNKVHAHYGIKPTSSDMKKYLRELGFMDKVNKKVIKVGDNPVLCLIYDKLVKKNLGLHE